MTDIKKKYINIYLKRNAILIAFLVIPVSILFLIVSLFADVLSYDIWVSFVPIIIGMFCFALSSIYIYRFLRMIQRQEDIFNVQFNDNNAQPLGKGDTTFLSDDWLIHSGSCAFYRGYIKSFSKKVYRSGVGVGYKVTIKTTDGRKYKFWTMSSHDIDKYRKWAKMK